MIITIMIITFMPPTSRGHPLIIHETHPNEISVMFPNGLRCLNPLQGGAEAGARPLAKVLEEEGQ